MDNGKKQRMNILESYFESRFKEMLNNHSWKYEIVERVEDGEYIVVEISRSTTKKKLGLLYTCGTKNEVYRRLDKSVDLIVLQGEFYHLENFAYGINTEVIEGHSFFEKLKKWNIESDSEQLIAETIDKRNDKPPVFPTRIESEAPIEQIWQYLKLFSNKTMAKKIIEDRLDIKKYDFKDETLEMKAEGLAFCMQNAYDYFKMTKDQKLSHRIINLYYGMISFASAEIIASTDTSIGLMDIENFTKYGHGLYTFDGNGENEFESLIVGVLSNGFFKKWMDSIGKNTNEYPSKKPKSISDLNNIYSCSIIQLFARIPELEIIFGHITNEKFKCIEVVHDMSGNRFTNNNKSDHGTYLLLRDMTYEITAEDIRNLPFNFKEVQYAKSENDGLMYRVRYDCKENESWYESLPLHNSPFVRHRLLFPIFQDLYEFRVIATCLLYALSIIVRYRPSIWRDIITGKNEKYLVMIEQFLDSVERVIPEDFLNRISGKTIRVRLTGSIYA
jgi:hypothetical protein